MEKNFPVENGLKKIKFKAQWIKNNAFEIANVNTHDGHTILIPSECHTFSFKIRIINYNI